MVPISNNVITPTTPTSEAQPCCLLVGRSWYCSSEGFTLFVLWLGLARIKAFDGDIAAQGLKEPLTPCSCGLDMPCLRFVRCRKLVQYLHLDSRQGKTLAAHKLGPGRRRDCRRTNQPQSLGQTMVQNSSLHATGSLSYSASLYRTSSRPWLSSRCDESLSRAVISPLAEIARFTISEDRDILELDVGGEKSPEWDSHLRTAGTEAKKCRIWYRKHQLQIRHTRFQRRRRGSPAGVEQTRTWRIRGPWFAFCPSADTPEYESAGAAGPGCFGSRIGRRLRRVRRIARRLFFSGAFEGKGGGRGGGSSRGGVSVRGDIFPSEEGGGSPSERTGVGWGDEKIEGIL